MAKRTVIAPNEELLIQGQLTVVGNVIQVEETTIVTNIQNHTLTINSDGDDADARISLNRNNTYGNVTYNGTDIIFSQNIQVPANGSFKGHILASDDAILVDYNNKHFVGTVDSLSNHDTSDLAEDPNATTTSGTMYFTEGRSRASISVTDTGGDGSLSYNSTSGVITYTGPSAAEVRAHFTASNGVNYNSSTGAFQAVESEIQHDSLDGFVADEHIAHSGVTLTAGAGLTGGGTIAASRTFNVVGGNGITVNADDIITDDTYIKGLFSAVDSGGDGSFSYSNGVYTYTGPSASEARAHFTASNGVSYNSGTGAFQAVESEIQHDSLDGFVADEHIAHSGVTLTAGTGLTGGGDITASRTFNVIGGDGITANADDIQVDSTVVRTSGNQSIAGTKTFTGSVNLTGATATASTQANTDNSTKLATTAYVKTVVNDLIGSAPGTLDTLGEIADALNDDPTLGGTVTSNANRITALEGIDLIAGAGLTGGATDLLSDVTFNVGAGTGINVNANTIEVDMTDFTTTNLAEGTNLYYTNARVQNYISGGDGINFTSGVIDVDNTVVRTSGNQSIAGTKTFTGELVTPSSSSTANGAIYYDNSVAEAYIYVGGSARKITPAVDAGDVEDVGASGINVYAGTRVDGSTTYHGIKSLSTGSYATITESANVITIDSDISAIRGALSAVDSGGDGTFSYDSATGTFTYAGVSQSQVRGYLSATGSTLSYDSGTGVFTSSADDYDHWKFTTATSGDESITSGERVTFQGSAGISVTHSGSTITISGQSGDISSVTAGNGLTGGGASGAVTLALSDSHVRGLVSAGGDLSYNSSTGEFSYTTPTMYNDSDARNAISVSGDLAYNSSTGVISYTTPTERTDAEVRGLISAGGDLAYNSTTGVMSYTTPTMYDDGDARSAISASGDLSYNSGTGVMSFTERTDAEVRGLFSASGDLSYNSSTGVFSFTDSDTIGTVTSVSVGTGLDVSNGTTTPSISLDLSELTDMTADVVGANDELILLDSGAERKKAINEFKLSQFNNDLGNYGGWSTTTGTVTSVSGGAGLTGTVTTSGSLAVGAGSYINVNADDVAVDATSSNTANKVVARDGSGNFSAGVITATATQARYADLAEKYASDQNYQPGTVVVFGGEKEITVTDHQHSPRVAGVISTDPAYKMNCEADGLYVALRGRVPCKVIGPVAKGDVLITSDRPGFAMTASDPAFVGAACIVGKALQDHPTPSEGVVEIVV
jgi:hypothetical protein